MEHKGSIQKLIYLSSLLSLLLLLVFPLTGKGDQTQYFYDELGRLVGVSDSQGNMAVYQYDAVGNLLSIQRFSGSTSGIGIFLLSPSEGIAGTQIEIRGYGFSSTPSANQVSFNGAPATVLSSTSNSIITIVPGPATTGPLTVTNANGTATSPKPFTVFYLPVIQGISPNLVAQGSTNYNTIISGFNLTNATSVSFSNSGITAQILSGGTTASLPINLVVASTVPIGSYNFSVTTPIGTGQSGTVTVTVKAPSPASSVALPISVFMPSPAQFQPSGSEIATALGLSVFLPPSVTQNPTGPESVGTLPLSVYLPPLANQFPSGPESVATLPASVYLPPPLNQQPSGPESAATLPLSIFLPSPSTVAPSGSETAAAPPESVSMP